ncbi:hypothetical protein [Candidatus Spongiisocius sp.]|uniref:hypothetical protein n=1 Tax=Candidatus Spongiisocius sp. TaxID=3101273 RepID=UPI003B5994F7
MRSDEYADLIEIIQRALDRTAQAAINFEQEHRWPWNRNAGMNFRQSVIRAALHGHPHLEIVEDCSAEFGRIKVVSSEGGRPYLLKPLNSLSGPSPIDPDSGVQQPFFDTCDGEPLLAYQITREGITLYQGEYREVQQQGGRSEYEIVGELRVAWTADNTTPPFNQEDGTDWMAYLDDQQGEAGTIS